MASAFLSLDHHVSKKAAGFFSPLAWPLLVQQNRDEQAHPILSDSQSTDTFHQDNVLSDCKTAGGVVCLRNHDDPNIHAHGSSNAAKEGSGPLFEPGPTVGSDCHFIGGGTMLPVTRSLHSRL